MDAISVLSFKVDVWSRGAAYIQVFHFVLATLLQLLARGPSINDVDPFIRFYDPPLPPLLRRRRLWIAPSGFTLLLGDRETNYFSHKSALYFLSQSKGVSALNWFLFSKIDVEFLDEQLPTLLYFAEH